MMNHWINITIMFQLILSNDNQQVYFDSQIRYIILYISNFCLTECALNVFCSKIIYCSNLI